MTEDDDAFIRTIVDNPGADLPRLVYADWLDDRSDPRGPFLRAEVEWAQPWKNGQRPGDATELRAVAVGLDPLWVARVCRPPVGVCCDHLRFTECGRRLEVSEVLEVEKNAEIEFPIPYRALLLNYNAGLVLSENDEDESVCFFAIGHGYATKHEQAHPLEPMRRHHTFRNLLHIADPYLAGLYLGVSGIEFGKVFQECGVKPQSAFGGTIPVAAESLPTYLETLDLRF